MAGFKNKLGPIKVCLERDQVNALLSMLDTMVVGGSECAFGDMAKALRDKITRWQIYCSQTGGRQELYPAEIAWQRLQ